MGWNSQEKDKRMKREVKCWSVQGPVRVWVWVCVCRHNTLCLKSHFQMGFKLPQPILLKMIVHTWYYKTEAAKIYWLFFSFFLALTSFGLKQWRFSQAQTNVTMGLVHWATRLMSHCMGFSHNVNTSAMFSSSSLNHSCCRMWMKHREIIELPVENKKNQIYLLFSAGETDKITLIYKPLPVRSCRLGKGSDNTPRHCSSTGKGMTMRPSASWGKSLMKLLSLREKEKCITISRTVTFLLFFFVPPL